MTDPRRSSRPTARPDPRPGAALPRCAAVALFLASAVAVSAEVDVAVLSRDKVDGTLDPGTETESIRVTLPAGCRLKAKAGPRKGGPDVGMTLTDHDLVPLVTGTVKGPRASVAGFEPAASGEYVLRVTSRDGTGTGEYRAAAVWRSRPVFRSTGTLEATGETAFPFSADGGSLCRISVRGKGGVTPRITVVDGVNDFRKDFDGDPAQPFVLPATGDYSVNVDDPAGVGGPVEVTISLRPPKRKPLRVDVTSDLIGGDGEELALARVVDVAGGEVFLPDQGVGGGLEDLTGAGVLIPAGALALPTSIIVGSAPAIPPLGLSSAAGPTVFFGPEGLTFSASVTLTIPVDLTTVGGDTSRIRVFVRDGDGVVSEVDGPFDFSVPGWMSFPSTHFSSYRAFADPTPQVDPFTIDTVTGATAFTSARGSLGSIVFLAAESSTGTIVSFADAGPGNPLTRAVFAGGGMSSTDGTAKENFLFPGPVTGLFVNNDGQVYAGTAAAVYRISAAGIVTRILGTGTPGDAGDNGPGPSAQIQSCADLVVDLAGNVYVCDETSARVRLLQAVSGNVVTEFGTGVSTFGSDTEAASATTLQRPRGIAFRPGGGFFVLDRARIRALNRSPDLNQTVSGDATGQIGATDAPASAASGRFSGSTFHLVPVPGSTAFLVEDRGNFAVRLVDLGSPGSVTTVVGTLGTGGSSPDGTPAPFAIQAPLGCAPVLDGATLTEVLFLEDTGAIRVTDVP